MPTARVTPYSLIFEHDLFEARFFPAIEEEAAARGGDARSFETFVALEQVTELLGRLLPDSEAGGAASAAVLARHARLLYHAFHFWRQDARVYALDPELARTLLQPTPWRDVADGFDAPAPSGYAQLPTHLLWARVEAESPPEPVDGFFWTLGIDGYDGGARLELVFALGLRSGRPGLSLIDVSARIDAATPAGWERQPGRDDGNDFANILPGGELNELRAIVTEAEAVKLAGRWFTSVAHGIAALDAGSDVVQARLARG
jgi:hypothetical protein